MTNQTQLPENLLRQLALMQHLGEDYFITDGVCAYVGTLDDAKETFTFECGSMEYETSEGDDFNVWCRNNLTSVKEIDPENYGNDYLVLTDSEADEKAKECIVSSLWAFTPSFLAERTELYTEVFEAIQGNGKCECNNDTIYNLIQKLDDIDSFVQAAISADGRGHFLSSYDGIETEETTQGVTFYIYKVN